MNLRSTDEIDDHITGCIHFLVKKQEAIFYTLKAFQNTCVKKITHILSNLNKKELVNILWVISWFVNLDKPMTNSFGLDVTRYLFKKSATQ